MFAFLERLLLLGVAANIAVHGFVVCGVYDETILSINMGVALAAFLVAIAWCYMDALRFEERTSSRVPGLWRYWTFLPRYSRVVCAVVIPYAFAVSFATRQIAVEGESYLQCLRWSGFSMGSFAIAYSLTSLARRRSVHTAEDRTHG